MELKEYYCIERLQIRFIHQSVKRKIGNFLTERPLANRLYRDLDHSVKCIWVKQLNIVYNDFKKENHKDQAKQFFLALISKNIEAIDLCSIQKLYRI